MKMKKVRVLTRFIIAKYNIESKLALQLETLLKAQKIMTVVILVNCWTHTVLFPFPYYLKIFF